MLDGESWLTAAIPMDNPYCSCKLTRVQPGTTNVTGKVDIRVVNYNRNPYDWSLIQDSEVG